MNGWERVNSLDESAAVAELGKCCGAKRWAAEMAARRPFGSFEQLIHVARTVWGEMKKEDILDAFTHHPRIGEKQLREKFASTANWASAEQASMAAANEETLKELARLNDAYFKKFGYIFIVCATGKSATEMLAILKSRLRNGPEEELRIAAAEQMKITEIRLRKM